jgi:hypothetical protein
MACAPRAQSQPLTPQLTRVGDQRVIYYAHAQSLSDRPPGAGGARVRNEHGYVRRSRRSLCHWSQHAAPMGATRPRHGRRDGVRQTGWLAVAGRPDAAASAGPGKARPHDRRIDPRVQPRGRPRCARASLECVARAAADGIRLQKKRSRPAEEAVREAQEYMSVPNLSSAEGDVDLRIRGL